VRPARAGEVDAETAYVLQRFGFEAPERLEDATGLHLILVDHNEVDQALPHIERANILEVWEHHRMGDLRLPSPILFHCEPVGATATLIAELYPASHVVPSSAIAGILLAAILSDTVLFRSATTSDKDRRVAARLEAIAHVDAGALGAEMLRIKTAGAEQKSAASIVGDDFKVFVFDGCRVGISQVEVGRPGAFADRRAEILQAMRALRERQGLAELVLMITDVERESSELWFVGDRRDAVEKAFGRHAHDAIRIDGCMSRKKQVVPRLEAAFEARDRGTRVASSARA
jgi:manganese-dependent inorganic pyrophosphatase